MTSCSLHAKVEGRLTILRTEFGSLMLGAEVFVADLLVDPSVELVNGW